MGLAGDLTSDALLSGWGFVIGLAIPPPMSAATWPDRGPHAPTTARRTASPRARMRFADRGNHSMFGSAVAHSNTTALCDRHRHTANACAEPRLTPRRGPNGVGIPPLLARVSQSHVGVSLLDAARRVVGWRLPFTQGLAHSEHGTARAEPALQARRQRITADAARTASIRGELPNARRKSDPGEIWLQVLRVERASGQLKVHELVEYLSIRLREPCAARRARPGQAATPLSAKSRSPVSPWIASPF
jgi:hypothetical protein